MALKARFDKNASIAEQMKVVQRIENDVIQAMRYAGEKFVTDARSMTKEAGGFGDVTGNLRASIGYFIMKNGRIVEQKFEDQRQIAKEAAMAVLNLVGSSSELKLIGVAGMNYASAVESRGYNVISFQADAAIVDLTSFFNAIERKNK
jgi:hypothetical protein